MPATPELYNVVNNINHNDRNNINTLNQNRNNYNNNNGDNGFQDYIILQSKNSSNVTQQQNYQLSQPNKNSLQFQKSPNVCFQQHQELNDFSINNSQYSQDEFTSELDHKPYNVHSAMTSIEIKEWLLKNQFESYAQYFECFTGVGSDYSCIVELAKCLNLLKQKYLMSKQLTTHNNNLNTRLIINNSKSSPRYQAAENAVSGLK
ncbi:hypothetical protein HELRODRAFT_175886 [Helobdella robusta]|uniref:Uncharacterized protein n=1 Tax=Helobdella robusta TaxID=6412 RepID=T1F9U2_HELRO|nr:hypothetical protein HELRODRAFT_175886 [Helobdella robusta]ESO00453.1 hypothetical protein HELRODRAFT_175886 [Helobdella robusta]